MKRRMIAILAVLILMGAVALTAPMGWRLYSSLDQQQAFRSWTSTRDTFRLAWYLARENPMAAWYRLRAYTRPPKIVRDRSTDLIVTVSPGRDYIQFHLSRDPGHPDSRRYWGLADHGFDGLYGYRIRNVRVRNGVVTWEYGEGKSHAVTNTAKSINRS